MSALFVLCLLPVFSMAQELVEPASSSLLDVNGNDLTGYFFNALIITAILLLISNLMGITLFPNITELLRGTGDLIRDNIKVIRDKTGRSLSEDSLYQMADIVDQAIYAYDKFQ